MAKLKLGRVLDEKPVRLTIELAAVTHRDLVAYSAALARETGQTTEPAQLVGPMVARFMAHDRGFRAARRQLPTLADGSNPAPPQADEPSPESA